MCMKKRCADIYKIIGVFLLGILGFPSCSKEESDPLESPYVNPGEMMAAYGTPTAVYKVSGKVFSGSGKPIPGIKVDVMFERNWSFDFNGKSTTLYTSADGSFAAEFRNYPRNNVTISFSDVDGDNNQGEFQSQSVNITAKQIGKGDGHWFQGTYSVSTTVKLDKK